MGADRQAEGAGGQRPCLTGDAGGNLSGGSRLVRVAVVGVNGEYDVEQVLDGVGKALVGQLVAGLAPLGHRDHQTATSQA
jgi:hypothetical protein